MCKSSAGVLPAEMQVNNTQDWLIFGIIFKKVSAQFKKNMLQMSSSHSLNLSLQIRLLRRGASRVQKNPETFRLNQCVKINMISVILFIFLFF